MAPRWPACGRRCSGVRRRNTGLSNTVSARVDSAARPKISGMNKKDGDPSIERYGQPSNGSERLRHIPFDPRRLDFVVEPGDLLQRAGGEQPDRVALTSLHTVQKYLDIAGRAFDKTDPITVGEPIVKISVRLVTEAIQAREELAVQNDPQFPGQLPPVWRLEPGLQIFGGAIEVLLFSSRDQADHCPVWGAAPQGILDGLLLLRGCTLRTLRLRGLGFHSLKQKQTEQNQAGVECLRHGPFDHEWHSRHLAIRITSGCPPSRSEARPSGAATT